MGILLTFKARSAPPVWVWALSAVNSGSIAERPTFILSKETGYPLLAHVCISVWWYWRFLEAYSHAESIWKCQQKSWVISHQLRHAVTAAFLTKVAPSAKCRCTRTGSSGPHLRFFNTASRQYSPKTKPQTPEAPEETKSKDIQRSSERIWEDLRRPRIIHLAGLTASHSVLLKTFDTSTLKSACISHWEISPKANLQDKSFNSHSILRQPSIWHHRIRPVSTVSNSIHIVKPLASFVPRSLKVRDPTPTPLVPELLQIH
jgi:hypothetical protein